MYIKIFNDEGVAVGEIAVSLTALQRARVSFNPSNATYVDVVKALAAGLYTVCEEIVDGVEEHLVRDAGEGNAIPGTPVEICHREAATAATHIQAGAMFAVSAATAHLIK